MRRSGHEQLGTRLTGPVVAPRRREAARRSRAGELTTVHSPAGSSRLRRLPMSGNFPLIALTDDISEWEIVEGFELPAEVQQWVPLGDPCHYRMHISDEDATGRFEFCGLGDGFFVHITDCDRPRPFAMSVSAPELLRVRIARADDAEYASAHGDCLDITGPGAVMIIEPAGQPPAEAVFAGRSDAASVYVHRNFLRNMYAGREHELPAPLQAFIAGTLQQTIARRLPFGPGLLRCHEDLHECELEGQARRMFICSKALEILCRALTALAKEEENCAQHVSALTRRGVLKAQQRLQQSYISPPSLEDLAHDVGMSRSSLCAGFRQIVGQTVFDYVADLRMQRALEMLTRRDASITQIAHEVGYSHPSSFSLAVQRRFGTTPSELRRRTLPTM